MSRSWRIEYAGALYHILSRGNEGRDIVNDDQDRRMFIKTLADMAERFEGDIFAFVLMNNHYHVLMRTQRANLSRSMQWFGATYTRRFNNRHFRQGHLFQGRFKSMLVENDAYLLRLSYYIHRNPVRAGMVKRMAEYKWSSYRAYAYGAKTYQWLDTELILAQFLNTPDRHRAYRQAAQKYAREERHIWNDLRYGIFLGTQEFVAAIKERHLPEAPHGEVPAQGHIHRCADADSMLNQAARLLDCDLDAIRYCARVSAADKTKRDFLVYLLWQTGLLTNRQIGDRFGLTYSAISRRVAIFKEGLKKNRSMQKRLDHIKSLIKM